VKDQNDPQNRNTHKINISNANVGGNIIAQVILFSGGGIVIVAIIIVILPMLFQANIQMQNLNLDREKATSEAIRQLETLNLGREMATNEAIQLYFMEQQASAGSGTFIQQTATVEAAATAISFLNSTNEILRDQLRTIQPLQAATLIPKRPTVAPIQPTTIRVVPATATIMPNHNLILTPTFAAPLSHTLQPTAVAPTRRPRPQNDNNLGGLTPQIPSETPTPLSTFTTSPVDSSIATTTTDSSPTSNTGYPGPVDSLTPTSTYQPETPTVGVVSTALSTIEPATPTESNKNEPSPTSESPPANPSTEATSEP